MIEIKIELWTKPSWMMDIEGKNKIDVKMLRRMGDHFKGHLDKISSIIDNLQKNGWIMSECYGAIYHLSFYKDGVETEKQIKEEMKNLGINVKDIDIEELEDE